MYAMGKVGVSNTLVILLITAIVVSVAGILLNLALLQSLQLPVAIGTITGFATETGTAQFQQNGSASILLSDPGIAIGAGFFNSNTTNTTCSSRGYSVLESNDSANPDPRLSPNANLLVTSSCWFNQSAFLPSFPNPDFHRLQNNGTVVLNLTAQGDKNARDFICGIGATCNSSFAQVQLLSKDKGGEAGSCSVGLTGGYENLSSGTSTNATIGLCDMLSFDDQIDELEVTVNISVPSNAPNGNKTLTITYTAIAAS